MHHAFNYYPHFVKIKNLLEEAQRGIYFPAGCSLRLVDLLESIPVETGVDQITSFLQLLKEMANVASRSVLSTSDFENDIIINSLRHVGVPIDQVKEHLTKFDMFCRLVIPEYQYPIVPTEIKQLNY